MTKNWLYQLILGLVLICHSSYRGVVELFRDLFDTAISIGTVHNRLEAAAVQATEINQGQDLSGIKVSLHDEIYQADKPVLVGVDAASTCCYLLKGVEHRDEDTWGWHLLDVMAQGFAPTIRLPMAVVVCEPVRKWCYQISLAIATYFTSSSSLSRWPMVSLVRPKEPQPDESS
ncbi:MAG: hypothetical protein DCF15_16740 [Phormidesmis priestleyi]|uniref:Uncharacterized protein n=1 Tax=Phormidesmis priestleyi TaxID=268141 RepID=A0A2W4X278_9CYAN|nr:MAG: hypothetical protein DCF15_16740 [Phormidesmis priestleyi]